MLKTTEWLNAKGFVSLKLSYIFVFSNIILFVLISCFILILFPPQLFFSFFTFWKK